MNHTGPGLLLYRLRLPLRQTQDQFSRHFHPVDVTRVRLRLRHQVLIAVLGHLEAAVTADHPHSRMLAVTV